MIFIGVDPGVHGAIAHLEEPQQLEVYPMPLIGDKEYDIQQIKKIITPQVGKNYYAAIERQHCMPGEGLPRTFKTGFGYGGLLYMFAALNISHGIVDAKTWQSRIFKGQPSKQDTKVSSGIIATRLYPNVNFRISERARTIADGMTDAACIATYAQRFYGQKLEPEQTCVHKVLANNPDVCIKCGEMV